MGVRREREREREREGEREREAQRKRQSYNMGRRDLGSTANRN